MERLLDHLGRRHDLAPVVREDPRGLRVDLRAAPFRCWALAWTYLGLAALPAAAAWALSGSPGLLLAPVAVGCALLGLAGPVLPRLVHFGAERWVVDGRSLAVVRAGLRRRVGLDHIAAVEVCGRLRVHLRDGTHLDLGSHRPRADLLPLAGVLSEAVARRERALRREEIGEATGPPAALEALLTRTDT